MIGRINKLLSFRNIAVATVLCAALAAVDYFALASRRALMNSHTAVFGKLATSWVHQFVRENDGDWPRSWEELRTLTPPPTFEGHDPDDTVETYRSVVAIDFDADPRVLATQTAEEFQAIRALDGLGIDHRDYWEFSELLETLREFHAPDKSSQRSHPTVNAR